MSNTKNIFVSHYHSDAEKIEQLNALLFWLVRIRAKVIM